MVISHAQVQPIFWRSQFPPSVLVGAVQFRTWPSPRGILWCEVFCLCHLVECAEFGWRYHHLCTTYRNNMEAAAQTLTQVCSDLGLCNRRLVSSLYSALCTHDWHSSQCCCRELRAFESNSQGRSTRRRHDMDNGWPVHVDVSWGWSRIDLLVLAGHRSVITPHQGKDGFVHCFSDVVQGLQGFQGGQILLSTRPGSWPHDWLWHGLG